MRCANCGKEFGSGKNCQNCGIDRVTGLANYSGYNSSHGSNSYDSSSYGGHTSPNTTVCYACSEIIPLGATFCPVCGKKLLVTCPNCGHEYSSQYPVCSKCGTNRKEYNKRKRKEEEERQRREKEWEQSPERKAELERERKEREKKESMMVMTFWSVFFIGSFVLMIWLDSVVDKNWLNQELIDGFNLRKTLLACISMGVSFGGAYIICRAFDD